MKNVGTRLLHHVKLGTPCVLRRLALKWPCTRRWVLSRTGEIRCFSDSDVVEFARCRTRVFGHFSEERSVAPWEDVRGWLKGPQLDGFWYYMSTPLPARLRHDVHVPRLPGMIGSPKLLLWAGQGVHTATHSDGMIHNLFIQLHGHKEVALLGPLHSDEMEPLGDFGKPNASARSLFADPHPSCIRARLGPGDVLYLPPYWWHEFRIPLEPSEDVNNKDTMSVSVACWFRMKTKRERSR